MPFRRRRRRNQDSNEDGRDVQGPSSALTSFLREQGISAESVRIRYEENVRREQEMVERQNQLNEQQATEGNGESVEGLPDNADIDSDEEVYEGDEEVERIKQLARMKKRRLNDDDSANGNNANDDSNREDSVGKTYCLECDREFIVSVYSRREEKYGRIGYLCPGCTKIAIRRERITRRKELDARKRRKKVAEALLDRRQYAHPSLQDLCIKIISDNIDQVDLLGDIGISNKQKISRILSKKRSLDSRTMQLFLDPSLKELSFWDCSKIDKGALDQIAACCPKLESLTLDMCGHLHTDNLLYYGQKLTNLRSLSLNGPFLINNQSWQTFFDTPVGRNLTAFHLKNTHRFTPDSLVALLDNSGKNLKELTLSRLDGLDSKPVYDLLPHYLHKITRLEISYPHKEDLIDDDMIVNLLANNGEHLESLVLDGCSDLTDQFLISGVRPFCPNLTTLSLVLLDQITDNGITQLFTDWDINGGMLNLNFCRCLLLSDASIYKAMEHSSQTLVELSLNSLDSVTKQLFKRMSRRLRFPLLTTFDLSFVRSVDDSVLAILSRIMPKLTLVEVYGDSKCTEKAITRPDMKIIGRESDSL